MRISGLPFVPTEVQVFSASVGSDQQSAQHRGRMLPRTGALVLEYGTFSPVLQAYVRQSLVAGGR
jgi:hypothetical protein